MLASDLAFLFPRLSPVCMLKIFLFFFFFKEVAAGEFCL